jgi:hypothetical protein
MFISTVLENARTQQLKETTATFQEDAKGKEMHRRNEDNDGDRKFSFLCDGLVVAS